MLIPNEFFYLLKIKQSYYFLFPRRIDFLSNVWSCLKILYFVHIKLNPLHSFQPRVFEFRLPMLHKSISFLIKLDLQTTSTNIIVIQKSVAQVHTSDIFKVTESKSF